MSQTQAREAAKVATTRTPKTITLDIGQAGSRLLTKLSQLRFTKNAAERAFKPVDAAFKELYADAASKLALGDSCTIMVGKKVLGRVTREKGGKDVDYDLMLEAFPEAYQACVSDRTVVKFYSA